MLPQCTFVSHDVTILWSPDGYHSIVVCAFVFYKNIPEDGGGGGGGLCLSRTDPAKDATSIFTIYQTTACPECGCLTMMHFPYATTVAERKKRMEVQILIGPLSAVHSP